MSARTATKHREDRTFIFPGTPAISPLLSVGQLSADKLRISKTTEDKTRQHALSSQFGSIFILLGIITS
jgi:hypothetical protein